MSIDAGTVVVILVIVGLCLIAAVAVVVAGFVLAPRAGRGSERALPWWIVMVTLETPAAIGGVAGLVTGNFSPLGLLPSAIVACQVALFLQARRNAGR